MFLIREGEHSSGKVLLNIDGNKIKEGEHSGNKVLLNIDGNKIKEGGHSGNKVLLNIDGNKIKEGEHSGNKVLFNIDGNKIKEGEQSGNKVLFNIDGSKIKIGEHSGNKVLFNFSGSPHLRSIEIIAILYALGLIKKSEAISSKNASPASFKSARNAEELGGVAGAMLIDKVIKPLALIIFIKVKEMFKK
jgi:hypothetical protein